MPRHAQVAAPAGPWILLEPLPMSIPAPWILHWRSRSVASTSPASPLVAVAAGPDGPGVRNASSPGQPSTPAEVRAPLARALGCRPGPGTIGHKVALNASPSRSKAASRQDDHRPDQDLPLSGRRCGQHNDIPCRGATVSCGHLAADLSGWSACC
jgi:hypothetical protein